MVAKMRDEVVGPLVSYRKSQKSMIKMYDVEMEKLSKNVRYELGNVERCQRCYQDKFRQYKEAVEKTKGGDLTKREKLLEKENKAKIDLEKAETEYKTAIDIHNVVIDKRDGLMHQFQKTLQEMEFERIKCIKTTLTNFADCQESLLGSFSGKDTIEMINPLSDINSFITKYKTSSSRPPRLKMDLLGPSTIIDSPLELQSRERTKSFYGTLKLPSKNNKMKSSLWFNKKHEDPFHTSNQKIQGIFPENVVPEKDRPPSVVTMSAEETIDIAVDERIHNGIPIIEKSKTPLARSDSPSRNDDIKVSDDKMKNECAVETTNQIIEKKENRIIEDFSNINVSSLVDKIERDKTVASYDKTKKVNKNGGMVDN
ncbi:hypothetical protein O9G_000229 [Rozella allomycis CSF55]|uniref:F-BAR domain-containing protein n=1 Tax=Rozella allomycis (strain CSF55) TaxID=988480 RepID=A0A075AP17_ROZAC|nr:hypothetical protein O9G_000229 [Rozella allomycis CSF55]|eukprot:EPZ31750.1 hypothetical protein O9G_000229 [Rozella allomycis CSF55]